MKETFESIEISFIELDTTNIVCGSLNCDFQVPLGPCGDD